MENREDLKSIFPFLPLVLRSSSLFWPPAILVPLKALSKGPVFSNVNSGRLLSLTISDLSAHFTLLSSSALLGYSLFFDDLIPRADADRWFNDILPKMADLLLKLPFLLETHYQNPPTVNGVESCLRLLEQQHAGIVILSQELIGAFLACAFFCLFPTAERASTRLPSINFDGLFECLYENYMENQESKIKCIIHYFERICSCMPLGNVSFERKVLPLSFLKKEFWSKSNIFLCRFEVDNAGLIEDHRSCEALEVDFANRYLGGGVLYRGCVQEEIRFMINPELILGMLFLSAMKVNEAIEIVGSERFSKYTGYASSFRFSGDYVDNRDADSMGRNKTRIIAIDALSHPGKKQFELDSLLREINKAFCGFSDQCKHELYLQLFQAYENRDFELLQGRSDYSQYDGSFGNQHTVNLAIEGHQALENEIKVGIITGNWGCGAFGGDPEVKAILQWLAASQALRPFVLYCTFDLEQLQAVDQVTQWILSEEWTVGELWTMLVEYGSERYVGKTKVGFFEWLLPSISSHTARW